MNSRIVVMITLLAVPIMSRPPDAEAGITNRSRGIRLTVRPRRGGNLVAIRWSVSRKVARKAPTIYDFQYWADERGWVTFLGTRDRTHGRIPVIAELPGDDSRYCFRMIAVGGEYDEYGEGEILGSGTSGNEGPCL